MHFLNTYAVTDNGKKTVAVSDVNWENKIQIKQLFKVFILTNRKFYVGGELKTWNCSNKVRL